MILIAARGRALLAQSVTNLLDDQASHFASVSPGRLSITKITNPLSGSAGNKLSEVRRNKTCLTSPYPLILDLDLQWG